MDLDDFYAFRLPHTALQEVQVGIRNSLAYDYLPGGVVFGLALQGRYILNGHTICQM